MPVTSHRVVLREQFMSVGRPKKPLFEKFCSYVWLGCALGGLAAVMLTLGRE